MTGKITHHLVADKPLVYIRCDGAEDKAPNPAVQSPTSTRKRNKPVFDFPDGSFHPSHLHHQFEKRYPDFELYVSSSQTLIENALIVMNPEHLQDYIKGPKTGSNKESYRTIKEIFYNTLMKMHIDGVLSEAPEYDRIEISYDPRGNLRLPTYITSLEQVDHNQLLKVSREKKDKPLLQTGAGRS